MDIRRRRWFRYSWLAVVLIGGGLLQPVRMAAPAEAQTEAFVISVRLPDEVVGGTWVLTVPTSSAAGVGLRLLDTGSVPKGGTVRIPVDLVEVAKAAPDDTVFLHVSASRMIDKGQAWATSASVGLPGRMLAAGGSEELEAVAAERVSIHWDRPDTAPVPTDRQRRVDPSPPATKAAKPEGPATAPTRGAVRPLRRPSGSRAQVAEAAAPVPEVKGRATGGQGMVPQSVVAPVGCRWYGACEHVKASKLFPGVQAFRWFSSQGLGTIATFEVASEFEQKWQNGVRAGGKVGPFKAEGFSTRTKSDKDGIVDTWPVRADCWNPSQTGDGPNCGTGQQTGHGFVPTFGRDTWQWQKVIVSVPTCYEVGCRTYDYTEERVRNYGYDGGTEISPTQIGGFDYRPSEVQANRWGRWAKHLPDATVKVSTETEVTQENGATVAMEFSAEEDAPSGSFTSTSTQKKLKKISDTIHVRDQRQLPFLSQVIRYDGNHPQWQYIYWTCEKRDGWNGGDCWDHGS